MLTSKIYFLPSSSSRLHPVNKQNSVPTKHISPVLRQTTVGVPENPINLLSSTSVRWKVRSTNVCKPDIAASIEVIQMILRPRHDAYLILFCQGHLQRNQARSKCSERSDDPQNIVLLESTALPQGNGEISATFAELRAI